MCLRGPMVCNAGSAGVGRNFYVTCKNPIPGEVGTLKVLPAGTALGWKVQPIEDGVPTMKAVEHVTRVATSPLMKLHDVPSFETYGYSLVMDPDVFANAFSDDDDDDVKYLRLTRLMFPEETELKNQKDAERQQRPNRPPQSVEGHVEDSAGSDIDASAMLSPTKLRKMSWHLLK